MHESHCVICNHVLLIIAARILGRDESPPAYRVWLDEDNDGHQFTGINFAVAGSSVYNGNGPEVATSRGDQIARFGDLVNAGDIDLEDSVALVAVSGINDYRSIYDYSSDDEVSYPQIILLEKGVCSN